MSSKIIKCFKIVGLALCAVTFITLTIIIYFHREPLKIDAIIRDFAYKIRGEKYGFIFWVFRLITEFGNLYIVMGILLYLALATKLDYRFFLVMFGIMLSVILNVGLKDLYSRERPEEALRWMNEDSTSFPSGHATAAGFMYTFLIYLAYHTDFKVWKKRVIYGVCGALIPFVMLSRIILGVHYFTDVIAGFATGFMVSCFCMLLYRYCANNNILTRGLLRRKNR